MYIATKMQVVQDRVTEADRQKIKDMFSLYDKDGTEVIPLDQLGNLMRVMGQFPTEAELEATKAAVDADGNGVVEMPEFVDLISQLRQPTGRSIAPSESELSEAMRSVFDHDRDGYMSAAEFRHVMTMTGERLTDEELEPIMRQFQPDGDGLVRCQDFTRCMLKGWEGSIPSGDRSK